MLILVSNNSLCNITFHFMLLSIFCYYTSSNDINPIGAFLSLIFMGIFIVVAIRIWIGNKIDDHKLSIQLKNRDTYLTQEASKIIEREAQTNYKFYQIKCTHNWKHWFIKGYIHGATNGNSYYYPGKPYKRKSDYTLEEWEEFEIKNMDHIKEDSDYFGGNKEMAIFSFFEGHKFGLYRFEMQGEAI